MAPISPIASRQHPLVRRCRALAAGRGEGPSVLLDGEHLVAEALDAGVHLEALLTDGGHPLLAQRAQRAGADVHEGTPAVLDSASPVRTTSGVVAIASWAPRSIEDVLEFGRSEDRPLHRDAQERPVFRPAVFVAIGLIDVQDPGNVGAVIRSADAFGGAPVLALGQTADPGGWKALRGAMGSTFRVPVARGDATAALHVARTRRIRIAATTPTAGESIAEADWSRPTLVLLGSEGSGLPADVVAAADIRISIPMRAEANSLNVAATAAVVLYEIQRRQRAVEAASR